MAFFISDKKIELEIAKRVSDSCEQIITEMGAEIHDDLVQKLSIFRLYLDQIERAAAHPSEVESLVIKMRVDFEQVVNAVRNVSRRLMPAHIPEASLIDTIKLLCHNMEHPGTGHIHFENNGEPKFMASFTESYLLRIVQELIHNAFKHSAAWHIWVRLYWSTDSLVVEVEDDGSGFAKIQEFAKTLKRKNNTLKIRSTAIGASIDYQQGAKGLLAKVKLKIY